MAVKPLKPVRHPAPKVKLSTSVSKGGIRVDPKKKVVQGDINLTSITINENGTFYAPAGTAYNEIVVNIGTYENPKLAVTLTPSQTLYDVTVDTLKELVIVANVTKGTSNVSKIEFQINGAIIKTVTEDCAAGGIFNCTKTFDPATNSKVTVNVIVTDAKNKKTTVSKEINFVGKSYYGTVGSDVTQLTAAEIKALNNKLAGTKAFVYSGINMDYGKVAYAYPASFGNLTSIKDTKNNLDYSNSFTKSTIVIDEIEYNCYLLIDAVAAENVQVTFA